MNSYNAKPASSCIIDITTIGKSMLNKKKRRRKPEAFEFACQENLQCQQQGIGLTFEVDISVVPCVLSHGVTETR